MYNAIYGVMQDMDAYFAGSMYYSTVGTAPNRKFCVSFYNIPLYNCSSMLQSSQIVLYENSNIIEVYISHRDRCTASNNSKGVVGIQNSDGTKGLAPQGRNLEDAWEVSTPEAWRFVPVSYINYFTWYKGSGFNGEIIGTNNNLTLNRGFKERDTVTVRLQNNSGLDVSDSVIVDWGIKVTALYDTITAGEEYIFGNISIYQSNTYTRTLTGSNGCDSIIVLHLAVLPFAPVVLSLENASAENGSIILTWENAEQTQQMIRQRAPSEQQVTYKIYRNGNFLAETTEMRYEDTEVETGENYCYKIRIFLLNDVGSNYSEEVCTMLSALNEVSQNDLQIYPNPVHSELTIKNLELKKGDKIEIYNISGKICMTYDYNFTTINVLNLPKGVYLIKAGNAVRKFVKE
ncbi:MAG: T9SS type A sorting domain-containing protein, partial [Prevotellaceae bacterium]|jgi:hypothetical protein|nr:T9SS type A sorting domain-containing protein [Prevotellaceae bacterium]